MRESELEFPVEPQNSCKSVVLNVTLEKVFYTLDEFVIAIMISLNFAVINFPLFDILFKD